MSRRSRKGRRSRKPNLPSQTTAAAKAQTTQRREVNLAEDYAYVTADLRRIALIATAMLVALVVLSFVLR